MAADHATFHSTKSRRVVLVIDDEIINQQILGNILKEDYQVLFAGSGEEARTQAMLYQDVLSVILLDLILPDINGLQILREFKNDPVLSRVPVIVLSSDTDSELDCLTLGAIDFIPKPYPIPEVILTRVLRIVELSEDQDIIQWTERDHLTGLYNLDYFYHYAEQFDVYHKELVMDAILLDVNHFHMINERYGKVFGDNVLRRIASRIRELIPGSEGISCRRSADTFMIYCTHREDYAPLLEQLSLGLSGEGLNDKRIRLRMGVYSEADKTIDIESRFDHAKTAADTVRGSFTKAIGLYDSVLHESELYAEQLLEGFEEAIREKQFVVYFQPKFDVRPEIPVLSSAEALVRWQHPTLGIINPGIFIPLFEGNGLIERLDHYVWRETVSRLRDWQDRLGIRVPVSVNVSRVDMYDPDMVNGLETLLSAYGLRPHDLLLQITQSAYTQDSIQIIETVDHLRQVGFRIEMDDFGTGYSSLNMISTLPIDALKLDMQFIRNAFSERKDTRMLEVILEIASILEVPTIAEGVETAEQMFTLKAMGCDIVQGYYFSKPLPPEDFEAVLIERKNAGGMEDIEDAFSTQRHRSNRKNLQHDQFTYDALHDPVTGLYNGSAFDVLLKDADHDHIALLILDIMDHAQLKKDHTPNLMDRLALHVADVLRQNFRSVDYLCRIRDDEFAVILTRVISSQHELISEKIDKINEVLSRPVNDLPPVALAAGVAFSDRETPSGDIFHDADTALIRIRTAGRCGCEIY